MWRMERKNARAAEIAILAEYGWVYSLWSCGYGARLGEKGIGTGSVKGMCRKRNCVLLI